MNPYYLLVYTAVSAIVAFGVARMFFGRAADRGMSASQMLFAGLVWFIMILGLLFYERYLKAIL